MKNDIGYIRYQEQKYKNYLKKLYKAKGHRYCSPVYNRYVSYSEKHYYKRFYRSKRSKKVKRYCNRQVRRYKKGVSNGNNYRRLTEFWWELY